jgi:hypothetical protein
MTSEKSITNYFILPVTILIVMKMISKVIKNKSKMLCMDCYKDMDREITAFIIASVYLVVYYMKIQTPAKMYLFYAAAIGAVVMSVGLVRVLIDKFITKKTPASIGAEAAVKAVIEKVDETATVTEAKITGAANGAKAASDAATEAGLSEKETTEAIVVGQVTGAAVAESVAKKA